MIAVLVILLAAPAWEAALARADALAAAARACEDADKDKKVAAALEAYAVVLAMRPKDGKLVPRVRRRRVSLLKHAGRPSEALAELDRIVSGRARRKDKARALYDAGRLLEKGNDFHGAALRYRRALDEYGDIVRVRAQAALARGRVLEKMARPREAERVYRFVVARCGDAVKEVIGAYDALALLALTEKKPRIAQRWLRKCMSQFERRSTRGDKYGALVARLLGEMKAPVALARFEMTK